MQNSLIPEKALESHIAILGKTGSGKSNTAKVVAERIMAAGGRVCVVDPTGTWWGMRLRADGMKPSKFAPVIFGGNHADIPIAGEHGAAIAEAVATSSTSAIIDTRVMTVGQRTKFFTAFAETLLRTNKGVLHLIIDEAHVFAPQGKVPDPQSGAMLHAANNLVSLGRGIGLRIILISQRPAKLHKDSLTQVETLVAMRLIAPQDRKAVDDWMGEWAEPGQGKEIMTTLPSLKVGEAWVWAPALSVLQRMRFPLASTFDSGQPLAGDAGPALTPIDVDSVTKQLEQIKADVLANDPARLKRRIAELEAAAKKAPAADLNAIEAAEKRGHKIGYAAGFKDGSASKYEQMKRILISVLNDEISAEPPSIAGLPVPAGRRGAAAPARQETVSVRRETKPDGTRATEYAATRDVDSGSAALTPAKRKILVALRELEAIGQTSPDKQTVAWFADASPKSSAYANNLGALRTAGLIEYPGQGLVALTDAGQAEEPPRAAPTHDSIMALVRSKLAPAQMRMLEVAISAWPEDISVADLANEAGASPTSSAFANNRGRLRSLGLLDYPSTGWVRAADLLFPGGANG